MNVLIVNNQTKNIRQLELLFENHATRIIKYRRHTNLDREWSDLIILSGSNRYPAIFHTYYKNELDLIKTSSKPIIGICLGFELIAKANGIDVKRRSEKINGLIDIQINPGSLDLDTDNKYKAYEAHRWSVFQKNNMDDIAKSKYGYEILKVPDKEIYGLQFHPEIIEPKNDGKYILNKILKRINLGFTNL